MKNSDMQRDFKIGDKVIIRKNSQTRHGIVTRVISELTLSVSTFDDEAMTVPINGYIETAETHQCYKTGKNIYGTDIAITS